MNSLASVAKSKKLDRVYVDHVASLLRPILKERFGGNETAMAKDMGVSQPQLNAVLKKHGGERGAGIVFLLAVRAYLKDKTLDEILGLDPPEFVRRSEAVRLSEVEATIERLLDERLPPELPRTEPPLLPAATITPSGRRKRS